MKTKIIIVEDDIPQAMLLTKFLDKSLYAVYTATNGKDGLEIYKKNSDSIIITDLNMPLMTGYELIHKIKEIDEDSVILVQTAEDNPSKIIEVMKLGIYDYILKPYQPSLISMILKKAAEVRELRESRKVHEAQKFIQLKNQMEWYKYKDRASHDSSSIHKNKFHENLFLNIRTNLTQGAGFGIIASITDLILESPQDENGNYIISQPIMEIFQKNNEVIHKALKTFQDIENIPNSQTVLGRQSILDVYNMIKNIIDSQTNLIGIKNNKVTLNDPKEKYSMYHINVDITLLKKLIYELFINALKFSVQGSEILILLELFYNHFSISILNEPITDSYKNLGIPNEYKTYIFEPFVRLSNYVNEGYNTLDYGLGLTMVDKITKKLNLIIDIDNVNMHNLTGKQKNYVKFSVEFKL